MTLPRLYQTTIDQRLAMSADELDSLYAEYREFWRGAESGNRTTDHLHGTDIAMTGRVPE